MRIESKSKRESLEIVPVDRDKNTVCFHIKVANRCFTGEISEVWFEKEKLADFCKDVDLALDRNELTLKLEALSDFEAEIVRIDNLGHFKIFMLLKNPVQGAELKLTLETEYTYLKLLRDDFGKELGIL